MSPSSRRRAALSSVRLEAVTQQQQQELGSAEMRGDFAILDQSVGGDSKPLIYLDSAATSQKPEAVVGAMRSHEQRDVPHNYKLCLSDGGPPGGSSLPCPICRYTRDRESGKLPDVECSATACHARFHKRCLGSRTHERIMEKRGGTSCCPLCLSTFRFKVKTTA